MRTLATVLLGLVLTAGAEADTAFWLRNTDAESLFLYWTVDGTSAAPAALVLPALALAPGGRHGVAPGERVRVSVGPGRMVVGVFVPWTAGVTYLTPLTGGFVLPGEGPTRGTVLVDGPSWVGANRGRLLEAPLEAWGLDLPRLVLDGRTGDWDGVPPALAWGQAFRPGGQPWPPGWPRVQVLQAVDREGALWVRLTADRPWAGGPAGVSLSLALRRPGAFLEWPLTGADGTVWSWVEGTDAAPVGFRKVRGADLEAWVPWDRLTAAERRAWTSSRGSWALLVTENGETRALDLGPARLEELP